MTTKKCLDYGFVKLRNIAGPTRRTHELESTFNFNTGELTKDIRSFDGDDTDPANSARISFDKLDVNRSRADDLKLYEYLIANKHWTPVEMLETWWEMKLPIFVARQFVRHRASTINEESGRYVTLSEDWYIPEVVGGKAKSNKQGQEDNLKPELQELFKQELKETCAQSYLSYLHYLDLGVAPEHARLFLHVNHYTHWLFKIDLRNLMNFLMLRSDSHAQIEARIYSEAMFEILSKYLPKSMEYFDTFIRMATKEELVDLQDALEDLSLLYEGSEENEQILLTVKKFFKRLGVK